MIEVWNEFWFGSKGQYDLAIFRILILGYFFIFKLQSREFDLKAWLNAEEKLREFWIKPWLIQKLKIKNLSLSVELAMIFVYKASLILCIIGLFTRLSAGIALLAGIYLLSKRHGLKIRQSVLPIHFFLLTFALSPSGKFLSLDSFLFSSPSDHSVFSEVSWGAQMIRTLIALIIFQTGISKLRHSNFSEGFLSKGNLATLLRMHDFKYFYVSPVLSISKFMHAYPICEKIAAYSTVIIEVLFPLCLFSSLASLVLVPSMALLIVGFRIFMGPRFDFFNICILVGFAPWSLFYP